MIGLTHEETFEFERLDGQAALPQEGGQAAHDDRGLWVAGDEARWRELYAKHEGAWKAWMAQSRADQGGSFSLY
ncbi:hypothetical protein [Bradyrhizobium iriomotense]|uniref:Uncharacterized protein n=1 Tax=Bradyrhizobium iriomotense TaxID=441950 RepID=A0ABQ6B433_9BRAD|nr:hypothetical protein GCM10007857_52450 [Bradyrhizobium iriomotense]